MTTDDRRASAGGSGCGGEGGGGGRFVSWLRAEKQPLKEMAAMIVTVESCEKNKVMCCDVRCCGCVLASLALSSVIIKKIAKTFYFLMHWYF
jgi:hypothetical protein